MIKLVCFIQRKQGLSRESFRRHWLEQHGPLIGNTPELAKLVVRYEQNVRLDADYAREESASGSPVDASADSGSDSAADSDQSRTPLDRGFDGSTIMWFESVNAYQAFAAHPLYASRVAPDEASFMDRATTSYFLGGPADLKCGDPGDRTHARVKLLSLLKRREDRTPSEFHAHWAGPHADLFTETPVFRDRILAYQQNHRLDSDYAANPATRWDGLAEQWYASLEDFYAGVASPAFEELVAPDEELFIDRAATRFILSSPPVIAIGGDSAGG